MIGKPLTEGIPEQEISRDSGKGNHKTLQQAVK